MLTSGTLTPFSTFEAELGIPFEIKIQNPHIIDKSHILPIILRTGPSRKPFNFNYNNRDDDSLYVELGETMVNLFR